MPTQPLAAWQEAFASDYQATSLLLSPRGGILAGPSPAPGSTPVLADMLAALHRLAIQRRNEQDSIAVLDTLPAEFSGYFAASVPLLLGNVHVADWVVISCAQQADAKARFIRTIHALWQAARGLDGITDDALRLAPSALTGIQPPHGLRNVLQELQVALYIVDSTTNEPIYANPMLRKRFPDEQALHMRCMDMLAAQPEHTADESGHEFFDPQSKRWYSTVHSRIYWPDGRIAYLFAFYDIQERKLGDLRLERMQLYDDLLGIPNRMMCRTRLDNAAQRDDANGHVVLIDLDDFKLINDVYGHDAGDALLKGLTQYLQSFAQLQNRIYRFGGDEFVLVLEDFDPEPTREILQEITQRMERPWAIGNLEHYCTASVGVVQYPKDGRDGQELLKNAEIAMVQAKLEGKNKIHFYCGEFNGRMQMRLDMEHKLRRAVADNCRDFVLHYQPEVDIASGRLVGAEALIRWNTDGQLAPPGAFISIAEELGLIAPMGAWALGKACKQCASWQQMGLRDLFISVNLSLRQLANADFVDVVVSSLLESGLSPGSLVLEITESMAMPDHRSVLEKLHTLRSMGVRIAMDDFGTGYSSLGNLRRIPLDIMKLDRSFLVDITSPTFLEAIIDLAHSLNLAVCCEGVETEQHRQMLRAIGCDVVQGYLLGRPVPAAQFTQEFVLPVLTAANILTGSAQNQSTPV